MSFFVVGDVFFVVVFGEIVVMVFGVFVVMFGLLLLWSVVMCVVLVVFVGDVCCYVIG